MNKFRMQQVTVVQQDDLQQLMQGASKLGETRESVNRFGAYTQTSGKISVEMDVEEAAKKLGRTIVVPKDFDVKDMRAMISQSNTITLNIHVDEVNKAMSKLGAKKLLPASIDGKPITLETGEVVSLYARNGKNPSYSFTQQPVPVVTVDPSIPVSEALDAVVHFPLLPESLKQSLQKTSFLSGGAVPLPVIAKGQSEKIAVGNIDAVITITDYGRAYYTATWVKNGQLYMLNGMSDIFASRQAFVDKVTELVKL
jgi:CBS domain-containing protein